MALQSRAVAAKQRGRLQAASAQLCQKFYHRCLKAPLEAACTVLSDDIGKTGLTLALFPNGQWRCTVSVSSVLTYSFEPTHGRPRQRGGIASSLRHLQ